MRVARAELEDWASALGVLPPGASAAVDGLTNGPVSREQPEDAQPVAADPTKVGE